MKDDNRVFNARRTSDEEWCQLFFGEGWDAYLEGKSAMNVPYVNDTNAFSFWTAGFFAAKDLRENWDNGGCYTPFERRY